MTLKQARELCKLLNEMWNPGWIDTVLQTYEVRHLKNRMYGVDILKGDVRVYTLDRWTVHDTPARARTDLQEGGNRG